MYTLLTLTSIVFRAFPWIWKTIPASYKKMFELVGDLAVGIVVKAREVADNVQIQLINEGIEPPQGNETIHALTFIFSLILICTGLVALFITLLLTWVSLF